MSVDPLHRTDLQGNRSPEGRWQLYASGYKRSADILVDRLGREPCCDELLYPILYLYGHFLELELKRLLVDSSRFSENELGIENLNKNHNLYEIWSRLKSNFRHFYRDCPPEWIRVVDACINEFSQHNVRAQAFRYPFDREGNQTLDKLRWLDIANFRDVMTRISNFLDIVEVAIWQEHEWHSELDNF